MPRNPNGNNNSRNQRRRHQESLNRFKKTVGDILGDTIRKPISAKLGYQDSSGTTQLVIPSDRTDQPNRYYFHEAGGNSFQGEAWLQPGALFEWQIRYNAPIRIQKDPLTGEWQIIGIDSRYAAQFFNEVTEDDGALIPYNKLAPGLLTSTDPESMKARVLSGAYKFGGNDEWKYVETQNTVDWSVSPYSSNVPTAPLTAKWVLVQLNYDTGLLEYKYGTTVPSSMTPIQVYNLDVAGTQGTYLPTADDRYFRCGYIKLVTGMTKISRFGHIWAVQEYLNAGGDGNVLDRIVTTSTGDIVVDSQTGNVVYTMIQT